MTQAFSEEQIRQYFKDHKLDEESKIYLYYHSLRYRYLIEKIVKYLKRKRGGMRILDVGPAYHTEILRNNFPEIKIDSLGFLDSRFPLRKKDKHFEFDLNDSEFKNKWPKKIGQYDIVILAEVIEHLYTSPNLVLNFLKSLLNKKGLLIIQTPNACALNRRLKMFLGRNPYDLIRENRFNPGHFREYTIKELIEYGRKSKFKVEEAELSNYFLSPNPIRKIYNFISPVLTPTLREGITIVFKKI